MKDINIWDLAAEITESERAKSLGVKLEQSDAVLRTCFEILSARDTIDAISFICDEMLYYERKRKRQRKIVIT